MVVFICNNFFHYDVEWTDDPLGRTLFPLAPSKHRTRVRLDGVLQREVAVCSTGSAATAAMSAQKLSRPLARCSESQMHEGLLADSL